MKQYPAHNSPERIAISGYYDGKTKASDKNLGKCSNKADLDDWEMDRLVESYPDCVLLGDGRFPIREDHRMDHRTRRSASQVQTVARNFGRKSPTSERPLWADITSSFRRTRQPETTSATRSKRSRQTNAGGVDGTRNSLATTSSSIARPGNLRSMTCGKMSRHFANGSI